MGRRTFRRPAYGSRSVHHHRLTRLCGGESFFGSPIERLHARQHATRYLGSSPVTARPRVWCTVSAWPVHTSGSATWHRPWLSSWLSRSTRARSFRHAAVDPLAHALLIPTIVGGWPYALGTEARPGARCWPAHSPEVGRPSHVSAPCSRGVQATRRSGCASSAGSRRRGHCTGWWPGRRRRARAGCSRVRHRWHRHP